jgi:hypothetical protein
LRPEFVRGYSARERQMLWLQRESFRQAREQAEAYARAHGWEPNGPLQSVDMRTGQPLRGSIIPRRGAGVYSVGDGWAEMQAHGMPRGFGTEDGQPLSVEEIARNVPPGNGPVLLGSCDAGQLRSDAGAAQRLANELGRPVVAPNQPVGQDGWEAPRLVDAITQDTTVGRWRVFLPGGRP